MVEKATMESKTKAATRKGIKTDSDTGVKNDFIFCLGPPIENTNSAVVCRICCVFELLTVLISYAKLSIF